MERGGPPTGGSSTVAFSASLAALPLKYLFKTLGCCAKISPEVLIEAHPSSGLRIKAVNQNHSAFLSCILRTNAFDGYECCAVEKAADKNDDDDFVVTGVQTALLAKHVLGCLRSNRVDRVRIKMKESNGEKVEIVCTGGQGGQGGQLQKTYNIYAIQDAEHLAAEVDSDSMLVQIVFKARSLGKFLGSHFNVGTQQDATFTFYNGEWEGDGSDATGTGTTTPGSAAAAGGVVNAFSSKQSRGGSFSKQQHKAKKCVEISSYVDKKAEQNIAGGPFQQLQTTVHLDANEEAILRYENRQYDKEFVKVTINLKDTLAMVKLCESIEQDVLMSCDKDGDPVSLRPTREFAGGHYASSEQQMHGGENPRAGIPHFDFDAEMVLAAMLPDEEEEEEDDEEEKRKEEEARRKDDEAAGRMTINYNNVPPQTPGSSVVPPSQTTEGGSVRPPFGSPSENKSNKNKIVWDGDDDDEEEVTATPAEEMSKRHKSS